MTTSNIVHVQPIIEELQRIISDGLTATLNLKGVHIGDVAFSGSHGISNLVNGVWIVPSPSTTNDPDSMPKMFIQKYYFRLLYIRRIALNENPIQKNMTDIKEIVNLLTDKISLPDLTNLPSSAQILWALVRSVEWMPPENDFVSRIAADLLAMAVNIEVNVRTRRG